MLQWSILISLMRFHTNLKIVHIKCLTSFSFESECVIKRSVFFNCKMQSINSLHSSINIFGVHQTNITSQFAYSKWRYPAFLHIVRNVMIVALCLISCLYVFEMNLFANIFSVIVVMDYTNKSCVEIFLQW